MGKRASCPCTPGVYGFVSRSGQVVRIGESKCMERRVKQVQREWGWCIGDGARPVVLAVEARRKPRFRVQQELQQKYGVGPRRLPPCNPRLSGLR